MQIVLHLDEDDGVPCVCKVRPILQVFPTATLVVDSANGGADLAAALHRAKVPAVVRTAQDPHERWVVGDHA